MIQKLMKLLKSNSLLLLRELKLKKARGVIEMPEILQQDVPGRKSILMGDTIPPFARTDGQDAVARRSGR